MLGKPDRCYLAANFKTDKEDVLSRAVCASQYYGVIATKSRTIFGYQIW